MGNTTEFHILRYVLPTFIPQYGKVKQAIEGMNLLKEILEGLFLSVYANTSVSKPIFCINEIATAV